MALIIMGGIVEAGAHRIITTTAIDTTTTIVFSIVGAGTLGEDIPTVSYVIITITIGILTVCLVIIFGTALMHQHELILVQ